MIMIILKNIYLKQNLLVSTKLINFLKSDHFAWIMISYTYPILVDGRDR